MNDASAHSNKKIDFSNLRYDLPASLVVFLVALPLCLGIALASDAPLFAGVVTGVIGGVVVGALSGSNLSVSGPAAGLTVIVASGIAVLGDYQTFLCAVVLAGLIQMLFGLVRAGFLASLFPNSVINGMLAAIGLTIILKQLPHALGGLGDFANDMGFWEFVGNHPTSTVLKSAFDAISLSAFGICIASLALLFFWESKTIKQHKWLWKIPGPLVAVIIATVANEFFHANFPNLALRADDGHLVQLPQINSFGALFAELRFPNFAGLMNKDVWALAFTLAAVGSIETLLSLESADKLDPQKRVSNTNRELFAQGTGNLIVGLIGGLPMTSVIVRSSANIYAGARTRLSAISHGLILLFSVLALSTILNLVPLAALAAVLIAVGFKLAHPKLFKKAFKEGWDQFLPFVITILAILFTDLLKGVMIGLLVGLGFVIRASFYSAIVRVTQGNDVLIRFSKDVTFIHKIKLRKELELIPSGSKVFFDASHAMLVDHDVFDMIENFIATASHRNIHVETKGLKRGFTVAPNISK